MKNHGLWMVIGCTLPLLLIFILPAFGVSGDVFPFVFIVLMFACHLFMMGGHHGGQNGHDNGDQKKHNNDKEEKHEHH